MSGGRYRVRLWRSAYQVAWSLRGAFWLMPWPHMNGAMTAVWVGDRVLMVRNSYNDYFTFPGGRLDRGEGFAEAAARELSEETAVSLEPDALKLAVGLDRARPFGQARLEIFECRLPARPEVVPDAVEIAEHHWWPASEALSRTLYGPVRAYLEATGDRGPEIAALVEES